MEIWKDIKGYEGQYQVSNLGMVRSITRKTNYGNNHNGSYKGVLLKPQNNHGGYLQVKLSNGKNKSKTKTIHRLVAMTFIDNPLKKPCVNHINEIKTDNRVENLEWCTQKENMNHGTIRKRLSILRTNNKKVSLKVGRFDLEGNLLEEYPSMGEAQRNGYYATNISQVCKGKRSTHGGYIWKVLN
jgi:hypothetical protein